MARALGQTSDFLNRHNVKIGGGTLTAGLIGTMIARRRMEAGDEFAPAMAKTAGRLALYKMAPPALYGMLGHSLARSYPGMQAAARQERQFRQNYSFLGGGHVDSQNDYVNRARGTEQIKRNRISVSAALGNEARRYHQTY